MAGFPHAALRGVEDGTAAVRQDAAATDMPTRGSMQFEMTRSMEASAIRVRDCFVTLFLAMTTHQSFLNNQPK
jgi:hypothetical protein